MSLQDSLRLCRASLFQGLDPVRLPVSEPGGYGFALLRAGTGCLTREGSVLRCGINQLLLLPPRQTALLVPCAGSPPLEVLTVQYGPSVLRRLTDADPDMAGFLSELPVRCEVVPLPDSLAMLLKQLTCELLRQQKQPEFADGIYRQGLLTLIAVLLARACRQARPAESTPDPGAVPLDAILGYIGSHLTEDLSLEALEKRFSVSRRHIQRRFKAATGLTVHEYIIRMKLERCKPYIRQGLPISQVYRLAGFGGYNHFFRAFKKAYGMTPKEYYRMAEE